MRKKTLSKTRASKTAQAIALHDAWTDKELLKGALKLRRISRLIDEVDDCSAWTLREHGRVMRGKAMLLLAAQHYEEAVRLRVALRERGEVLPCEVGAMS